MIGPDVRDLCDRIAGRNAGEPKTASAPEAAPVADSLGVDQLCGEIDAAMDDARRVEKVAAAGTLAVAALFALGDVVATRGS